MVSLISRLSPVSAGPYCSVAENFLDFGFQLRLLKWLALNLVVSLRIHQIFRAEYHRELAHIHLRDQDAAIALHHFSQIARKRIQIPQVNVSNAMPRRALGFQGRRERTVS